MRKKHGSRSTRDRTQDHLIKRLIRATYKIVTHAMQTEEQECPGAYGCFKINDGVFRYLYSL